MKKAIEADRDGPRTVGAYLKTEVFPPASSSALLRLIASFSMREAHMISQLVL